MGNLGTRGHARHLGCGWRAMSRGVYVLVVVGYVLGAWSAPAGGF